MNINRLTLLAALAVAALVTFNTNAADTPKGERKERPAGVRPGGASKLGEELGLTADQKTKFEGIQKDAAEKRKALREDTSLTPEQRREKTKAIAEETKTKLKEVLTAEQQAKLEELQKNRPARGEGQGQRKKADAAK